MLVKISKEQIFWNTIGDNKPSQTFLNNLKNRMVQLELKINFEDFYNISIVSATKDITYILTTHNGYEQFWFYNGIQKIINGGYVIKFQLDIFATYTLNFFETLKANNVKIKLNRSHKFNKQALLFKDELIESVPIIYNGYVNEEIQTTKHYTSGNYVRYVLHTSQGTGQDDSYIEYETNGAPLYASASANYYYVFKEVNDNGYMFFFPVLMDKENNTRMYMTIGDTINTPLSREEIHNTYRGLELLRRQTGFSNKFLGCYLLPNFYNFKNTSLKYNYITANVGGDKKFACLTLHTAGETIKDEIIIDDTVSAIAYNQQVPSFNYSDKLHQYALDKYDYEIFGNKILASILLEGNKVRIRDWLVNFTQSCFIKMYDSLFNYFPLSGGILELPANLPVWIDTYENYVNANKNQRDNQLNILRQTYQKNIVSNTFSTLFGFGGAIASGDFAGGFQSLFNGGMGFANSILGYENAKNTMKAQYEDAKNTMGDEIQAGNINDCVIGYFNYQLANPAHLVRHKDLTPSTIKALNNVLYLYGRYEPQIDTLTNFTVRNDFNYYLFDRQYLTQILPINIDKQVPQELYPYIIAQLSEGVRIWNTQPTN